MLPIFSTFVIICVHSSLCLALRANRRTISSSFRSLCSEDCVTVCFYKYMKTHLIIINIQRRQKRWSSTAWCIWPPSRSWADYTYNRIAAKTAPDKLAPASLPCVLLVWPPYFCTISFVFTYSNVFLYTNNCVKISEN